MVLLLSAKGYWVANRVYLIEGCRTASSSVQCFDSSMCSASYACVYILAYVCIQFCVMSRSVCVQVYTYDRYSVCICNVNDEVVSPLYNTEHSYRKDQCTLIVQLHTFDKFCKSNVLKHCSLLCFLYLERYIQPNWPTFLQKITCYLNSLFILLMVYQIVPNTVWVIDTINNVNIQHTRKH